MRSLSFRSRKWTLSSPKEPSKVGHGWNLYVVDTVTPLALYQEMVSLPLLWRTALFLYANCKAVSSHETQTWCIVVIYSPFVSRTG